MSSYIPGRPVYTPAQWNAALTGYYSIQLDSGLYSYEGASKPYSLTAPNENTIRFELHDGDTHWWDVSANHNVERDEIASRLDIAANGTPIEVSYGFTLEPGAPITANWMIVGQLHQDDGAVGTGSPPFAVNMLGEHMSIGINYTDATGKAVSKVLWIDPLAIVRGQEYDMDIKVVMDPSGQTGRLVVARDGVTIVDYSGPIGYSNQQAVYWAEGIYRDATAAETVAVDYSNLSIKTGSAVIIPSPHDLISAPILKAGAIAADSSGASNSGYAVSMKVQGAIGSTVTIFEGDTAVGSGVVGSDGTVAIDIKASTGMHSYYAFSTDSSGRASVMSTGMDVLISTAAQASAQLATLAKDQSLGAIYLTDSPYLDVGTGAQYVSMRNSSSVFSALAGGAVARTTDIVTGKAYDRDMLMYDKDGNMVGQERTANGVTLMKSTVHGAFTETTNYSADRSYTVVDTKSGVIYAGQSYNALGQMLSSYIVPATGGRETTYYNATTHAVTGVIASHADGSRVVINYGITGQAYTSMATTYDSTGKQVLLGRYDKENHLVSSSDVVSGTTTTYSYDKQTGLPTSYKIIKSDGSYSITTYGADGQSILKTDFFSATNALLRTDLSDPKAAIASISSVVTMDTTLNIVTVPSAPTIADTMFAAATTASRPAAMADTSQAVGSTSFTAVLEGSVAAGATVSFYDGKSLIGTATGGLVGNVASVTTALTDGIHSLTAVNAATGAIVASGTIAVGTSASILQQLPSLTKVSGLTAIHLTDAGVLDVSAGNLSAYTRYASTLTKIQEGVLFRVTDAISGRAYDQEVRTYDVGGTLLNTKRYAAGLETYASTLSDGWQMVTSTANDGSRTVTAALNGKTAITETFDAAGHETTRQAWTADGSKIYEYYNIDGSLKQSIAYNIDGSRVYDDYGITGRDYTLQTQVFNASGTLTSLARFDTSGHVTMAQSFLSGSSTVYSYDTSGTLISSRTTNADRSYSITSYNSDGSVQKSDNYNASRQLVSSDKLLHDSELHQVLDAITTSHSHGAIGGFLYGTVGNDTLTAGSSSTLLSGGGGADKLFGGAGNDILIGGAGMDVLTGGGGHNIFQFALGDSGNTAATADRITDFKQGDRIDLSSLENAVAGHAGFNFIGTGAFGNHAGEVQLMDDGTNSYVAIDLNGDAKTDMMIRLDGHHNLLTTDFLL